MNIQIADWVFEVDVPATMSLSGLNASDHCQCGYCRNYYLTIDKVCPSLRSVLLRFGIHIEGPDELSPYEPTIYEASYIVQGKILHKGKDRLFVDGVPVQIKDVVEADIETEHPLPYFVICIGLIELPWALDEPQDHVISPANEPEYLERMQKKLLSRMYDEEIIS